MAQQWLSASELPGAGQGIYDESGFVSNDPYGSLRAGMSRPENWERVAQQLGYTGPIFEVVGLDSEGGALTDYGPQFRDFIAQKQAEGYEFVVDASTASKQKPTVGLRGPNGQIISEQRWDAGGFGDFFKEFVLPSVGAYFGAGALGNALAPVTNALTGVGGAGGAAAAPYTGLGEALSAADLAGLSPDITGGLSGIAAPEQVVLQPFTDAGSIAHVQTPNALLGDFAMEMPPSGPWDMTGVPGTGVEDLYAGFADLGMPADANFAAGMGAPEGVAAITEPYIAAAEPYLTSPAMDSAFNPYTADLPSVDPEMARLYRQQEVARAGSALGGIGSGATALPGLKVSGSAAGDLVDRALNLINTPAGQAVLGAAGSVVGGAMEASAAGRAAELQSQAAQNALQLQREMFEYQKSLLDPYREAGKKALDRLSGAMGLGGPGSQQQMLEMDPGYGFRLGEGLKALERMQASRGNFLSGGALKAGQRFAQDTASQEYDRAFGRLADIAGIGRSTGTQLGTAGAQFGTSAGNIMGQEANALASARAARGSAYSNAIGGALGSYQNYLNRQQEERLIRDIFGRTIGG